MLMNSDLLMFSYLKKQTFYTLKIAIALLPCLIAMYLLFWLGKHEVWLPETPHRDKITILVLVVGLASSFLLWSTFDKRCKSTS